jgi:protein-S-isoprenylcysteine O-methyltransferase Ste14
LRPETSERSSFATRYPDTTNEDLGLNLQSLFHSVATGPKKRRELLTPVGLTVFGGSLALVIIGGLLTDRWLRVPALPQSRAWMAGGVILLSIGSILCGWCVVRFIKARGTPVPFNPPDELLQTGVYGRIRNPMLTGVFLALFGVGVLLHSLSILLFWTPGYILVHVMELKLVEEPELERRFGASYAEYRDRVPMFFPRLWRKSGSSGAG